MARGPEHRLARQRPGLDFKEAAAAGKTGIPGDLKVDTFETIRGTLRFNHRWNQPFTASREKDFFSASQKARCFLNE